MKVRRNVYSLLHFSTSRRFSKSSYVHILEYIQVVTDFCRVWLMTTVSGGNVTICANNAAHLSVQVDATPHLSV